MYNQFDEDFGPNGGTPEGGQLAATLSPAMRMELIQMGYNPMSAADIDAYKRKQRPVEGLTEVAGVSKYSSMGDHGTFIDGKKITYNDQRDYGVLAKEGKDIIDYGSMNDDVDPRQSMRGQMENYGGGDVNDRIMSKLSTRSQMAQEPAFRKPIKENPKQTSRPQIKQPIAQPKQLLTEAAQANKLGYTKGVKYINAFIALIKNPTDENRQALILEMNRMVSVEDSIHPSILPQYRKGIALAETELYKKIKNK